MPKLSELVAQRREERVRSLSAKYNSLSLIDFTDLTPLDQKEIDLFWPYEGSELERQIALRLATRTAEEAYKAVMARLNKAGCHKCGKAYHECDCVRNCPACWNRYYKQKGHQCDPADVSAWAKPLVIAPVL